MAWHIIIGTSPSFRVVFATGSGMTQNVGYVHQDPERIMEIQNTVVSFGRWEFQYGGSVCRLKRRKEDDWFVHPSFLSMMSHLNLGIYYFRIFFIIYRVYFITLLLL